MRWCTAISESSTLDSAISECGKAIRAEKGPLAVDLLVVFVSQHHASGFDRVPELVRQEFPQGAIVGCSAGGVIGAGREVEHRPGLAISAAHLPDVDVAPFHVETSDMPDADAPPDRWEELVHVSGHEGAHFVLLVDPFSFDAEQFMMGLDFAFPSSSKIGGMASGGQRPGENALFLTDQIYRSGAVGVALSGNVTVDTIVAQGCRPIGQPMQVTSVNRNVLTGLDDEKPIEVLQRIYSSLPASDQRLAQQAVFLGIAMDPMNETPQLGDFLGPQHRRGRSRHGCDFRSRGAEGGADGAVPCPRRRYIGAGPRSHADILLGSKSDLRRNGGAAVLLSRTGGVPVWSTRPRHANVPRQG